MQAKDGVRQSSPARDTDIRSCTMSTSSNAVMGQEEAKLFPQSEGATMRLHAKAPTKAQIIPENTTRSEHPTAISEQDQGRL